MPITLNNDYLIPHQLDLVKLRKERTTKEPKNSEELKRI